MINCDKFATLLGYVAVVYHIPIYGTKIKNAQYQVFGKIFFINDQCCFLTNSSNRIVCKKKNYTIVECPSL